MSKVVSTIVLPCFIFAQILRSFHINQYPLILEALIGCAFLYFAGYVVGYFTMKLLGYNNNRCNFMAAVFSSPHTTSIPVILLSIIGPVLDKIIPIPLSMPVNGQRRGYLYIILNSIFSNIWKWSGGFYLIQPEDEDLNSNKKVDDLIIQEKIALSKHINPMSSNANANTTMSFKRFIKEIINMPVIASFGTIFITMFPSIQEYLTRPDSTMYNSLISVNVMISKSYAFLVMTMLGLSLSDSITLSPNPETKKKIIFKGYDIIWICLGKLVLMPLLTAPIIIYLFKYILHADDIMLFLYLFMSAAPSAINMIVICTLKEAYMESISMMMMVMYGIAMITMTLGVTVIIGIIGYLNNVNITV